MNWIVILLILAIIAAIFGFGGIVAVATDLARILFYVILVLIVISVVASLFRKGRV